MKPIASVFVAVFLLAGGIFAQTTAPAAPPPPPQTPRQALLEVLRASDGSALLKHLPEITKKKLQEMGALGNNAMGLDAVVGVSGIAKTAAANGEKLTTEEAGPVLMTVEDPKSREKVEVAVDNDDLAGDEDDMQLGIRMSKSGEPDLAYYFAPRILLHMKQEQGIWRFEEVGFSAKAPIGNAEFLDALTLSMKKQQEEARAMLVPFALQSVNNIEDAYQKQHGTYSCSAQELEASAKPRHESIKNQIEFLERYDYTLKLSNCSGATFTAVAAPRTPGGQVFCTDQSKSVRYSASDGAESCLSSGELWDGGQVHSR